MMHILHSSFYRCRVFKNHYILCRKFKTPSCSDQCDLNIPDVVITTCQLVSTNVPGGLERSERGVFITFEIWIFFAQKRMDLLQEDFIHFNTLYFACFGWTATLRGAREFVSRSREDLCRFVSMSVTSVKTARVRSKVSHLKQVLCNINPKSNAIS